MAKLSVLYIVKNEEEFIANSLSSVSTFADEIIIVDTGSSDRTVQICRQFPKAKIFGHKWQHNFSQVRNYGIKQCSGDWIFYIDADEKIDNRSGENILNALKTVGKNVAGISVDIIECVKDWDTPSLENIKQQVRIFRNSNKIIFEGAVNETVARMAAQEGGINKIDAKLFHFHGRGRGQELKDVKKAYYKKLSGNNTISADIIQPTEATGNVGIVIPVFNSLSMSKKCIDSVCKYTTIPYTLCPVDNGSTDGTDQYLTTILGKPPIHFDSNVGVAKAKNAGTREILKNPAIKYICFLDNDTEVYDKWLETMIAVLESNPSIGMVGPLSPTSNDSQNISYDNLETIRWALPKRNPDHILVSSIGGFCMVIRTEVFKNVGFFEESFGLYGLEDLDYCMRVKEAGFDIGVDNRTVIEHKVRGTISSLGLHHANMISNNKFSQKWKQAPRMESRPRSPLREHFNERPLKTSIVVLTHNRLDMTSQCLYSIQDNTSNYELIIVDNGSTDGTKDWIKSRIQNVKIIENEKNLGVPIARNMGISASTGQMIVLMDNDVIVRAGWLEEMQEKIRNGADCVGIEAWKLNSDFAAIKKCSSEKEKFDYLGGACTIFKREVYEKIGLLDEGFSPAYYEDVDICIRAKNAGFNLCWHDSQKIIHRAHSTLIHGQKDFVYSEALTQSYERFAKKMRGELKVEHKPLTKATNKLKILYLGMQNDYGDAQRGESFESNNFYPSLLKWDKTKEMFHFDFVELGQKHGVHKMSNMLTDIAKQFRPDVLFGVWFDEAHDPIRQTVLDLSLNNGVKTIGWFCDSHYRYKNFDRLWAPYLDHCVTTSTQAMSWYAADGFGHKVIKSQWGASPKYIRNLNAKKDIDVSFVGQPHGNRRMIIDKMRKAGINIQVFGHGWDKRLSFDEMISVFNRSKININMSQGADITVSQIKGRNFEVPACGGFLLTGNSENLSDYYIPGKEIETFADVDGMIQKIKMYLVDEKGREQIADAGYKRTMKDHTFASRYDSIFQKAGLL